MDLRADCDYIVRKAIEGVLPDVAVKKALKNKTFSEGRLLTVAIGKAAYAMANAAKEILRARAQQGIVITKYNHAGQGIEGFDVYEAGHPIPDENSLAATEAALRLTADLSANDTVLFLISGGGSSLFEAPLIPLFELQQVTQQLLSSGANITEMNTIRKRLSKVKGGRFAEHCRPASLYAIVLSDIINDPLDMIASGPAFPDLTTCADVRAIVAKYGLDLSENVRGLLNVETPKTLQEMESVVTGSVRELCVCAADAAKERGYDPIILTDSLDIQAREAGGFLAAIARYAQSTEKSLAFIVGGETIVHILGNGKGGRNQEMALSAAEGIRDLEATAVFSVGSDGTDGPTDAAGGYVDGKTAGALEKAGISIHGSLQNNDAYRALQVCGGLLMTGPTGTNVNDVSVLLVKRP